ncbi:lanthionine synthetase LanC family protein [Taibaiella helva]|uniref:lanthionine synthetase LanC family protein n=1 Tax=Taibaiella helva TaxID=2301235 RepID=UPI000E5722A4|nr:lanthionine synthetase LanC family protein [Taibaiella helva]
MYEDILEEIATELISSKQLYQSNYGLLSGLTGSALFFEEYGKLRKDYAIHAEDFVEEAFLSIANKKPYAPYCAGISGACAGIDFLYRHQYEDDEMPFDFVDAEIDDYLYRAYTELLQKGNLDFLHGAVGMGFYYLERIKSGQGSFREQTDLLLRHLQEHAIWEGKHVKWSQGGEGKGFNISLSHGMSSIIVLLSKLLENGGSDKVDIKELLQGAVHYILDQEIDASQYGSLFPYASKENGDIKMSRLAWCYGDLGIGIGLLSAAKALADPSLQHKALAIFDFCANRRDLAENMVSDTSICHGTSGIAVIYHDLYLKTGNQRYQETAQYWLEQTVKLYREKKIFYLMDQDQYDTQRMSLLEGKAGVGLVLLNVHFNVSSGWPGFLLL